MRYEITVSSKYQYALMTVWHYVVMGYGFKNPEKKKNPTPNPPKRRGIKTLQPIAQLWFLIFIKQEQIFNFPSTFFVLRQQEIALKHKCIHLIQFNNKILKLTGFKTFIAVFVPVLPCILYIFQ